MNLHQINLRFNPKASRKGLVYGLDPVLWARKELGFVCDPWQADVLNTQERKMALNCCRQSGKSTVASIKGLHHCIFRERALILLLSPSERQSYELFKKVMDAYDRLEDPPDLKKDTELSMELYNRSRIIALPSSEKTIRGFSGVHMIIEDEAAAVPDEIYSAVFPMLSTTNGQYISLSTPRGKKGHFYNSWTSDDWKKVKITADMVPRFTPEFLESAKRELGSRMYAQEYLCEFLEDMEGGMFKREWFDIVDDYPRSPTGVRYWDLAATPDGDYTAGVKLIEHLGIFYVVDVQRIQGTPLQVQNLIYQTAVLDGKGVKIYMEQEPGSSGINTIDNYQRNILRGFAFYGVPATGAKELRAMPASAKSEARNVKLVRGPWNREFIDELCSFPGGANDDQVDAFAGAFNKMNDTGIPDADRFKDIR